MSFSEEFNTLTGHAPFPWQEAFYASFVNSEGFNPPKTVSIPTGLGKTSIIPVWLLALKAFPERMPRRLIYVVNRRTAVDQTTAEQISMRPQSLDGGKSQQDENRDAVKRKQVSAEASLSGV